MTGWEMIALMGIGTLAGFVNVLSAGGSMLTLPVLMLLGLPAQEANGTNRVTIALQSLSAVAGFRRAGASHFRLGLLLSLPATLGAVIGSWLALQVSDALFETVLVVVMAVSAIMLLLPQPTLATHSLISGRRRGAALVAMVLIGLYGGFIQVGVGVLFVVVLYRLLRIDLAEVNVFKVLIILIYTLPALLMFMAFDQVHWPYGLALAAGSMLGAWLAVKVNLSSAGAAVVRYLTLAVIVAILIRLVIH